MQYAPVIQRLIDKFERFPGIGPKTAQRLSLFVLKMDREEVEAFAGALVDAREKVRFCRTCFSLTDEDICIICNDSKRNTGVICVVEEARDMLALEKTGEFRGVYHVLQGVISPIEGVGPDRLRIRELLDRLQKSGIEEVILATNSNVEGEATAMYLMKLIKPLGIRVSRLASGLPVGSDLEYADEVTLSRALEGRRDV